MFLVLPVAFTQYKLVMPEVIQWLNKAEYKSRISRDSTDITVAFIMRVPKDVVIDQPLYLCVFLIPMLLKIIQKEST